MSSYCCQRMGQTTTTVRKLFDGRLRLERRNTSPMLYARTYIQGKSLVFRTKETNLVTATDVARDWYVGLLERARKGEQIHGRMFNEVAETFLAHANRVQEVSHGQRDQYRVKLNLLKPLFAGVKVTDVDAKFLLDLRNIRAKAVTQRGTPVKPATIKKDLIAVRLVLRFAKEWEKCLDDLPEFPSFRGKAWAVVPSPRPFLDYDQWTKVRDLAKERAADSKLNPRTQRQRQELHWFLLMCVGAALRVGEAYSLRWKDCEVVRLDDKENTEAVHMKVLGKHSRGGKREDAYGLFGAVSAFTAMKAARPDAKPDDYLFEENHREGMKELLTAADLRTDADGRTRDAKSLRQTGISMRLDRGPANIDYRDVAKWARTSPAMVVAFYDQTHPKASIGRITGFRKVAKKSKKTTTATTKTRTRRQTRKADE